MQLFVYRRQPGVKTNKRFLQTTVLDTVMSNARRTNREQASSPSQHKRQKLKPKPKPNNPNDNHDQACKTKLRCRKEKK